MPSITQDTKKKSVLLAIFGLFVLMVLLFWRLNVVNQGRLSINQDLARNLNLGTKQEAESRVVKPTNELPALNVFILPGGASAAQDSKHNYVQIMKIVKVPSKTQTTGEVVAALNPKGKSVLVTLLFDEQTKYFVSSLQKDGAGRNNGWARLLSNADQISSKLVLGNFAQVEYVDDTSSSESKVVLKVRSITMDR